MNYKNRIVGRGVDWTGPYFPFAVFYVSAIVFLFMSRTGLMIWQAERITDLDMVLKIVVSGLRMDTIMIVYLIALPALVAPFVRGHGIIYGVWRKGLSGWLTASALFLVFMETATPAFINEYDARPNRLFIEYLTYPKEVISMLVKGYKPELLSGGIVTAAVLFFGWRWANKITLFRSDWSFLKRLVTFPLIAALLFMGARSSLGHRPANPSSVAFSSDPLINDLTLSSAYSLFYAAYRMKDEADAAAMYGTLDTEKMLATVRKETGYGADAFTEKKIPTLKYLKAAANPEKPHNLVIILEESLGTEFVEKLGGLPLTPHLEKLSGEGWWFDRLYATGTRSVRGIEAVTTGFLPTPARSVVKLGKARKGFFTLAGLLSQKGYHTQFIYGGDSNFDNMKSFFLGNGFKEIIDQKDYKKPKFTGSWGVSDEDLFDKAHETFSKQGDRPFFSLVFSSSNHTPFEFPDHVVELYESPKNTVHNAVKYADHALGKFFEKAKRSNYWDHTVFLVVADHNSRVYGNALVPIKRFRIPGLIIGPGIKPGVYPEIASQIDLPPTLLSLMGISGNTPMLGRDLTAKPHTLPGRAMMQFYKNQAYYQGDQVVILQPGKTVKQFTYNGDQLAPTSVDKNLAEKALAHALWASWTYKKQLYHN